MPLLAIFAVLIWVFLPMGSRANHESGSLRW